MALSTASGSPGFQKRKAAPGIQFGLDQAARRRRGDGGDEVGIGLAAGLDQTQRIALALHVRQHLVVLVDQRQCGRARLERRRGPCMGEPHRHAGDDLQRLLHPPPANHLGGERLGLVEQAHQSRLELVGQEVPDRTDIENRRRSLIETGAEDIEQPVRLSHLRPADHHDPLVQSRMHRPDHRNDVGREPRITRARKPRGLGIDPVRPRPFVRRQLLRGPQDRRGQLPELQPFVRLARKGA